MENRIYEQKSNDCVALGNMYYTRVASERDIKKKISEIDDVCVLTKDILIELRDGGKIVDGTLLSFMHGEDEDTEAVDIILSDFGAFISEKY